MKIWLIAGLVGCLGTSLAAQTVSSTGIPGDCNWDGIVNAEDIPVFMRIIQSGAYVKEADCNGDGDVSLLDVDCFVTHLKFADEAEGQSDCLLGDVNGDGVISLLDIDPFLDRLVTDGYQCEADINQDGFVDLFDIDPFVKLLIGG